MLSALRIKHFIIIIFFSLPILIFCQQHFYQETIIPVGLNPTALVYNYLNQKLYCANMGSNSVSVINQITNQIAMTIRVGMSPTILLYNPTSNKIYCASQTSNDISIIDGLTNSVLNTVSVGLNPSALICDSLRNKVYCANAGSNNISVIDGLSDNVIATILTGAYPTKLVYNQTNNKIYCANTDNNTVSIIDGNNYNVINSISVGAFPYSLAYNPVANKIYCASWANGRIHIIDGATNQLLDSLIYFNSAPQSLVYSNYNTVWYVNFADDNIKIIDGVTNTISDTIRLSPDTRPYALFVDYGLNFIYCTSITKNKVIIINSTPFVFDSINIIHPISVCPTWIPSATRVYMTSLISGNILVYRYNVPGIEQDKEKHLQSTAISAYPNPAKSFFDIRTPCPTDHSEIKMFDVTGKMVKKQEFKGSRVGELRVATEGLNPGVYFIQANNLPNLKKIEIIR